MVKKTDSEDSEYDLKSLFWLMGLVIAAGIGFGISVGLYHLILRLFGVK